MLRGRLFVGLVVMFVAVRAEMETEQEGKLMKASAKRGKNVYMAAVIGSQLEKGIILYEDEDGSVYELKWEAGEENRPRIYRTDKDGEILELTYHNRRREKRFAFSLTAAGTWFFAKVIAAAVSGGAAAAGEAGVNAAIDAAG